MAEYLERLEADEAPQPAEYLRAYPQHAEDLRSFFRNHHWLGESSPAQSSSLIGKSVGRYRIEAEIARGGMGVVYRARQADLGRPVALKLISSGVLAGEEERRRFRIEAEAAAGLQPPGIIPIHEIGSWQGYEYFSMTLVEGPTLQRWVDDDQFDDIWSARVVRDIARAVAYAHRGNIVHRDLKPDNILMDGDQRPLVADFGLAKWHREGTMLTRTGQVIGTPHYMSPEQACCRTDCGFPADIYALGAILYALLTGRPPHTGQSAAEVLRSVLQDEPPTPRSLRREVSPDLETVCLQALRYDPSERYPTADALADDLDRFLAGDSPTAISSGLIDRVAREIRRDQHQTYFEAWGRTLTMIGGIIFIAHGLIYALSWSELPPLVGYFGPRLVMLGAIVATIYRARSGSMLPRSVAERPVWSIWLGYLATLGTVNLLLILGAINPSALFPIASALSGFGFLAMAGHVWGGSAILGAGFLIMALFLVLLPSLAPLLFGATWLLSLAILGRHYRQVPEKSSHLVRR